MDSREHAIRDLHEACRRTDWGAVALLLTDDVRWHDLEAGDCCGRDAVVGMLEALSTSAARPLQGEPEAFLHRADHTALLIGTEIAVYRVDGATIAEVWSHVAGYEPEMFTAVCSL